MESKQAVLVCSADPTIRLELTTEVPTQSLYALAQRGFNHVTGNEVAAKKAAFVKTEEGAKASEEDLAAKVKAWRQEALQKIIDGTLGVRAVGAPRATGVEALKRAIALEFLKAKLKAYSAKTGNKVTVPTGDDTINVAGKDYTREQLIDAMLRSKADEIAAEVERRQASVGEEEIEDLF